MILVRNSISFAMVRVSVDDLVEQLGADRSHASVADRIRSDFVSRWDLNIFRICFLHSFTF